MGLNLHTTTFYALKAPEIFLCWLDEGVYVALQVLLFTTSGTDWKAKKRKRKMRIRSRARFPGERRETKQGNSTSKQKMKLEYLRQELGSVLPVDQVPPSINISHTVVAAVDVVGVLCKKERAKDQRLVCSRSGRKRVRWRPIRTPNVAGQERDESVGEGASSIVSSDDGELQNMISAVSNNKSKASCKMSVQ